MTEDNNVQEKAKIDPAEARKRRRCIVAARKRRTCPDSTLSCSVDGVAPVSKKQRVDGVSSCIETSLVFSDESLALRENTKREKIQAKYDPDVPMSKDDTAAWRKEQRKNRNRESAAASRHRQRERITELEVEVSEWKSKYEQLLARMSGRQSVPESVHVNPVSNVSSTVSLGDECQVDDDDVFSYQSNVQEERVETIVPTNVISRPAVSKIVLLLNAACSR